MKAVAVETSKDFSKQFKQIKSEPIGRRSCSESKTIWYEKVFRRNITK